MTMHVALEHHGTITLVRPMTPEAKTWLKENTGPESTWWGGALAVEPRYVANLVEGLMTDLGAWPNPNEEN